MPQSTFQTQDVSSTTPPMHQILYSKTVPLEPIRSNKIGGNVWSDAALASLSKNMKKLAQTMQPYNNVNLHLLAEHQQSSSLSWS